MSEPNEREEAAAEEQSESRRVPEQYAPVPILLPLGFVLVFGLLIAYGLLTN